VNLRIHSYFNKSFVEGPYTRFVIWVQGCSIRCPGCSNKHMWDFNEGYAVSIEDLYNIINDEEEIEGVTFVGGEPFDQAGALALLAENIRRKKLGIVTFTGYKYEYLKYYGTEPQQALLEKTDLLIDGPFELDNKMSDLPWVGSGNQRFIHLSDRYADFNFAEVHNKIEIRWDEEKNKIVLNGIMDDESINAFTSQMRLKGFIRKDHGCPVKVI